MNDLTHFRRLTEILKNHFDFILGELKPITIAFEMFWPLDKWWPKNTVSEINWPFYNYSFRNYLNLLWVVGKMASSSRGDEFFTPTSSRLEPSHWAPEGLEILVFYATTTLSRNCENLVPERQDSCSSVGAARIAWPHLWSIVKFIYSEKATKFCEIFTLILTGTT